MRKNWLFFLLFLGVAQSLFALSNEIVVIKTTGDVRAVSGAMERELTRGSVLHVGDKIVTGKTSKVHVRFPDGGMMVVEENSQVPIDDYKYTDSTSDRQEISLLQGGVRWVTGRIQHMNPNAFKMKTKVAVTGVRGTYFLSVFTKDQQILGVYNGNAYLENDAGMAVLGEDEDFHIAHARSFSVKPKYLLEETGTFFDPFEPQSGEGNGYSQELENLQAELGDFDRDPFHYLPHHPFPGPFDWFVDFSYDNYFNSCKCH